MNFKDLQIKRVILQSNIKYKTDLINDLYDARESLTFDKDLVQSSHGDKMVSLVARIDELKNDLKIDKTELKNLDKLFNDLEAEFKKDNERDLLICLDYYNGVSVIKLGMKYYLSVPAIYKIIRSVNDKLKEYKKV